MEEYALEKSYRLPARLWDAACGLIGSAAESAVEAGASEVLRVMRHKDPVEQAYEVAREIKQAVLNEGFSYSDCAVLCRSTAGSSLSLEEAFSYYGIPYVLYNSASFFLHPTVRLLADLVESILLPDKDAALKRALGIPGFNVGPMELRRVINAISSSPDGSLHDSLLYFVNSESGVEAVKAPLKKALGYIEEKRMGLESGVPLVQIVRECVRELVFPEVLKKDLKAGVLEAKNLRLFDQLVGDIENTLHELNPGCSLEEIIESLQHAFIHFSQYQENTPVDEIDEGVRIMTVHQAKGLEFPFVYIIDATEEYFPTLHKTAAVLDGRSLRRLSAALKKSFDVSSFSSPYFRFTMAPKEHLEEERQLLYVAITRASRRLVINYTEESHLGEQVEPSPFIEELVERNGLPIGESAQSAPDIFTQLALALNREEIETVLHSFIRMLPEIGVTGEDRRRLDEVGLDSEFIFAGHPFEREPAKAPEITHHRFSASQLSQYLSCPRRYFYEKILNIVPERPREFDVGELVHLALERFHTNVQDFQADGALLEAEIISIFRKIWTGAGNEEDFELRFSKALQREVVKRKVEQMLRRYVRTESAQGSQTRASQTRASQTRASQTQAAQTQVVACERRLEFEVGGLPFVAKVDRIDFLKNGGGHRIIDYKTSQSGPIGARTVKKLFLNMDEKEDYAPVDFQLPLYLIGARVAGYDPVELCYYWLAQENSAGMFKKSTLPVGSGKDHLNDGELEIAKNAIVGIASRILAGDFPPEPRSGFDCQRCLFEYVCEE
jgi:ATP-dependent exoDNAse (exonuclease V) beta subunit